MALYDPIRDGFNEFNRLLIDSQTWDENHKQRAADRMHRDNVLESNLVQREFENKMAKERQILAEHGDVRAERQLTEMIDNNAFNRGIALNNMAINKEQNDRQAERWEADKKTNALNMQILGSQAKDITRKYVPVDTDLNQFIPQELKTNQEFMDRANSSLRDVMGPDAYMEGDLLVKRYNGETGQGTVIQSEPAELKKFFPVIDGLVAEFQDPNRNAKINIENLVEQQNALRKIASSSNKSNYSLEQQGMANRNVHLIDKELRKQYSTFKPENAAGQYKNRAERIAISAKWNMSNGYEKEGLTQQQLAVDLWEKSLAAGKAAKREPIQVYKRRLADDGTRIPAGTVTFDTVKEEYLRWEKDADGNEVQVALKRLPDDETFQEPTEFVGMTKGTGGGAGGQDSLTQQNVQFWKGNDELLKAYSPSNNILPVTPDVAAGTTYAKKLYSDKANTPILDEKGNDTGLTETPRNAAEAADLVAWTLREHKKQHTEWYQYWQTVKGNKVDREAWEEAALAEFGYLPTNEYTSQIRMGTTSSKAAKNQIRTR